MISALKSFLILLLSGHFIGGIDLFPVEPLGNSISNHLEKIQVYTILSLIFFLLWTLVRYTKKREIQNFMSCEVEVQKTYFLAVQNWALRPIIDCHDTEIGTVICQQILIFEISFYPITLEIKPGNYYKVRNLNVTVSEWTPFRTNFWNQKNTALRQRLFVFRKVERQTFYNI